MLVSIPWVGDDVVMGKNGNGGFWNRKKAVGQRKKKPSKSRRGPCTKSFTDYERIPSMSTRIRVIVSDASHREALACLTYGIQSRKGFVLLTAKWARVKLL